MAALAQLCFLLRWLGTRQGLGTNYMSLFPYLPPHRPTSCGSGMWRSQNQDCSSPCWCEQRAAPRQEWVHRQLAYPMERLQHRETADPCCLPAPGLCPGPKCLLGNDQRGSKVLSILISGLGQRSSRAGD